MSRYIHFILIALFLASLFCLCVFGKADSGVMPSITQSMSPSIWQDSSANVVLLGDQVPSTIWPDESTIWPDGSTIYPQ